MPCGFRQEDFFMFSLYAYVKHVTPGTRPFLTPGHYLNKLGRDPLGDAKYQIKALGLVVSDKKIFSHFPYTSLCQMFDPRAGPLLAPGV